MRGGDPKIELDLDIANQTGVGSVILFASSHFMSAGISILSPVPLGFSWFHPKGLCPSNTGKTWYLLQSREI